MTDDEAFAAAEATYRSYVDALNQVDLSDPNTFEAVYAWTTGEANAGERRLFTEMHSKRLTVSGHSTATLVVPQARSGTEVLMDVCLDVGPVDLVDESGASVVAPDRVDLQRMRVAATEDPGSPTGYRIGAIDGRLDGPGCV
ncbi:hypothetical protein RYJ27_06680 [Microbacterium limosum]|uniref:SnoaL-like domain-containing protein n=1 Tax=Microbacterium limosum TaxID=3079935 RepID=A0AAU0MJP8_9MICO|nr:hypothetical protein [Microbacterium sp. Y20]WOQ70864.1 hypothetical protein RYJ27_06680 [Microbacterium sp. Y20]